MFAKHLQAILSEVRFSVKDSHYQVLLDENTSLDYCLTKAMETIHHMRDTPGMSGTDFVTLIRLLIIAYHKYQGRPK